MTSTESSAAPNDLVDATDHWSGRRVVVTGAAGFTGRHLVAALAAAGADVCAVLRPGGSTAEFAPGVDGRKVDVVHADLRDAAACKTLMQSGTDTIFHVAAVFRTVGVSRESLHESHVTATQYLLRAGHEASVRRFVHVSTIGVQGPNPPPNATEEAPASPNDDYQITKYDGEQAALELGKTLGLPTVVVRPCAIYGAGDDRFLKIIRPISKGRFTMIGPGDGAFHLVHVEDLVRGIMLAGLAGEAPGHIITLGGEEIPSLHDFVALIGEFTNGGNLPVRVPYSLVYAAGFLCEKLCGLIGVEPPLHRRRVKFFGSNRSFDLSRAKKLLGYAPSVSLAEGVGGLVRWHRERGDIA